MTRPLRGIIAATSLVAVLFLGALSIRPDFHESLHEHAHDEEHRCAVVLFAHGLTAPVDTALLSEPIAHDCTALPGRSSTELRSSARHLFPPGRGPPALIV